MINTQHEYGEKTRYRDAEDNLTGGLIVGKKWKLSQHRKLFLLTTSPSLPHIDEQVDGRSYQKTARKGRILSRVGSEQRQRLRKGSVTNEIM